MLQQAITNTPKTDEKIECLSKEIDTKENQMDILEVENIINKKLSEWVQQPNGRDRGKKQELENRKMENISEQDKLYILLMNLYK